MVKEAEENLAEKKSPKPRLRRGARDAHSTAITLDEVRWNLARLWLLLGGCFVLLLIAQSTLGKYQGKVQNVWSWALPAIMPTLSLIITVLGTSAFEHGEEPVMIKKPFYQTVFWLSAVYLLFLMVTILAEPFTPYESVELLNLSNFWLAPFQGIVASAIGVLFFSKKAKQP
jgi:hypothetical protein